MSNDIQRQKADVAGLYSRVASTYGRVGLTVYPNAAQVTLDERLTEEI